MLIRYTFDNFCSFKEECEFSLEAPGGKVKKRFPDNYTTTETGYDLLKTAVIVGENAGGKSNFINGLKYLKSLFDSNMKVQSVNSYINADTLMECKNPKQKFNVVFLAGNNYIYEYETIVDTKGIYSEKLTRSSQRKSAEHVVFDILRDQEDIYTLQKGTSKEVTAALKNSNNSNGLFVVKLALLGNKDASATVEWMLNVLYPGNIPSDNTDNIVKQEQDLEKPYSKTLVIRRNAQGKQFKRELSQDSTGVREFFAWAVQIFRVVYENKVVFADEMDRVLNPILSDRVIAYINGMEHRGQFVFSTHNVLHLNLKTYMKEQIYFITKSKDELTSELYSLADFPEVRYENTKIYEFYMKGILGGTAFE